MWQIVTLVAVGHLLVLFLALFGFAVLASVIPRGGFICIRRPLSNAISCRRPIRGPASRLDGPVFDDSIDHSPSDLSHRDHRILSDSDL